MKTWQERLSSSIPPGMRFWEDPATPGTFFWIQDNVTGESRLVRPGADFWAEPKRVIAELLRLRNGTLVQTESSRAALTALEEDGEKKLSQLVDAMGVKLEPQAEEPPGGLI